MTQGLRCASCDTTINRRAVNDWLVNKKTPYLNCTNVFCNKRWSRTVLEQHADKFIGEVKAKTKPKAVAPKPVEKKVAAPVAAFGAATVKAVTKASPTKAPRPKTKKPTGGSWLDRIRTVAQHQASINGVVSVDDLRLWADIHKDHPTSSSLWGSVFQGDQWKKVSQKRSTYAKSRSRKVSVWALKSRSLVTV